MTARNLSFTVEVPAVRPALESAVRAAVRANAETFLNPPIANLGHRGIAKASAQVPKWPARSADPARDLAATAMLMERGGTGGALFRALYRDFLAEAADLTGDDDLRGGHERYAGIVPLWTEVAGQIAAAGESGDPGRLARASELLADLAVRERLAMRALSAVAAERHC